MKRKSIRVSNLLLDTENYRIDAQIGQPQAIRAMIDEQGEKLKRLAEDIVTLGLSPIETFMVSPVATSKTQFIVIEGNRRATALKLLNSPALAHGTKLEGAFRKLSEKYHDKIPKSVEAIVVPSKKDGLIWIRRRHDRDLDGIGIEDWSSVARDRADADIGKPTPAKDVREFVLANAQLTETQRSIIRSSKFNNTNLTRLLGTSAVRDTLGLKSDAAELSTDFQPDWFLKVMTDVVVAIADQSFAGKAFTVATIETAELREKFINQIASRYPAPKKTSKRWTIRADKPIPGNASLTVTTIKRQTSSTGDRKVLIPRSCAIKGVPDGKINDVFHELRKLDVEKFRNATAVLFRVFVEFSIDAYIKKNKVQLKKDNNGKPRDRLIDKWKAVEEYMNLNGVMTSKELKPVRDSFSNPHTPFSTESLNAYVHDPSYNPKAVDLKLSWNDLQAFLEKTWSV